MKRIDRISLINLLDNLKENTISFRSLIITGKTGMIQTKDIKKAIRFLRQLTDTELNFKLN